MTADLASQANNIENPISGNKHVPLEFVEAIKIYKFVEVTI